MFTSKPPVYQPNHINITTVPLRIGGLDNERPRSPRRRGGSGGESRTMYEITVWIKLTQDMQAVVAQIVSAYRDGGSIIDNIKRKRAAKRGIPIPIQLEETIKEAPEDIEREKRRGLSRFGQAFDQGDFVAIIALQHIVIQVQGDLLQKLRNAYDDDADLMSLTNDADMGRMRAIQVMFELQQRLLTAAAPVPSAPIFAASPNFATRNPSETMVGVRQIVSLPPTADHQRQLLEDGPNAESARNEHRGSRFKLFHHSKDKAHSRQLSKVGSSQTGDNSVSRVYTLPADAKSNTNVSQAQPAPSASPPQRAHPNSPPPQTHRQSIVGMNEPWHNPWAEDPRPPPNPTYVQPEPTISLPMPTRTSTSRSGSSTHSIPHPNPSNNYLGFCKGAWKLQDGDKTAMVISRDYTQSAQSHVKILRCSECKFEGHFSPTTIWERVFKFDGMKIRWSFLAKSHVRQKYPQRRDLAKICDYTYQCLFCAFLGVQEPAMHGPQAYRDHISQRHHGIPLNDVVLYKTGAIDHRICDDHEEFDINLYPRRSSQLSELSAQSVYG